MNVKYDDTFKHFYWLRGSSTLHFFIHALRQVSLFFFFFKASFYRTECLEQSAKLIQP